MTTDDHRARLRQARRFARPAGFLLALLLFLLLPTVAASCSPEQTSGTISGSLNGAQVVAGSRPSVEASGELTGFLNFREDSPMARDLDRASAHPVVRVVAVGVVLLLLLGGAVELIRTRRTRPMIAAIVAAAAGALVVVVELLISAQWKPVLRDNGELTRLLPENQGRDPVAAALETLHAGLGFWLVLATLAAIAVVNVVLLIRARDNQDIDEETPDATTPG